MPSSSAVTLEELIDDVDLEQIRFFELHALSKDGAEGGSAPGDDEEIQPDHFLGTATRDDGKAFRVRLRTEIEFDVGEITVDLAADYTMQNLDAKDISREVMQEFVNGVAMMMLAPYLRQAIADMTLRVFGASLTMPILQRGQLAFELGPQGDAESPDP